MSIPQNQSTLDRFARIILGGVCVFVASYITMPDILVLILMVLGLYLMISGLVGNCLIYGMLGIKTCK